METPKKCALCGCIEEKGRPTCQFCGEATWLPVWVGTYVEPELVPVVEEPKRGRPKK